MRARGRPHQGTSFFQRHFQKELDPLVIQQQAKKDNPLEILYLDVARSHLVSIQQIVVFKNLVRLDLTSNKLEDISPIGYLVQLEGLLLQGNQIVNIEPLSRLKMLRKLDLSVNQISIVAPLAGCSSLEDLDLRGNCIDTFEQLSCLSSVRTLRRLMLHFSRGNKVTDDPHFRTKLIYIIPWLKNIDFGPVQMEDLATLWLQMRGGAFTHLQGGMDLNGQAVEQARLENKKLKQEYEAIDQEVRELTRKWEQNHVTLLRQLRDAAK